MVSRENKYILKNVQVVNLLINKISDIVIALIANNFEKSTSNRHARSDWSSSGDNKPSLSFAPTFQNSPDPTQTNDMQILISLVPLLVSQSDGYYYSNQLLTHGFHSMQMPRLTGPHLQTGMTIEV